MILLISNKNDISLDYVVRELRRRKARFLRLNTEDLPDSLFRISYPRAAFVVPTRWGPHDLARDLRAILLRRPGKPFADLAKDDPGLPVAQYVQEQWHALIDGLMSLEGVRWMNHPLADYRMESKIVQLQAALDVGFQVPRTCITNSKDEAESFLKECGGTCVVKSLASSLIEYSDRDYFVFANIIETLEMASGDEVSVAPSIYQEYLDGKRDYRVTVVGGRVMAVEITGPDGNPLPGDWRREKADLRFLSAVLPTSVATMCVEVAARNQLNFGAIDLARKNGEFYFLEINPNGEWGWLQATTGLPIAEAIADFLVDGRPSAADRGGLP